MPADQYQLLPFFYKEQSWGKNDAVKEVTKLRLENKTQVTVSVSKTEMHVSPHQVPSDLKLISTGRKEREAERN